MVTTQAFNCFDKAQVVRSIAEVTGVVHSQVGKTIDLLEEGNTLPFIARYRKEATGGLDEIALRLIEDALGKAHELAKRKTTILKTIDQQQLLTPQLRIQIEQCHDKQLLEDLYLPFKPKRRTRAAIARERGLQPLADLLLRQKTLEQSRLEVLKRFVNPEKQVPDTETALQGACDIVAEHWAENVETRRWMSEQATTFGKIHSLIKRGQKKEDAARFEMYFDHQERVARVPSHRLLAMKRGEADGMLRVKIELDDEIVLRKLKSKLVTNYKFEFSRDLLETVEDCYRRLLLPAAESITVQRLKEQADEEAIQVFVKNLRELLLAAPAGPQVTMGIDPGFRTGCKVAVVDGTGKFLESCTIFPTPPRNDTESAAKVLSDLISRHHIRLIAIGNGTASRETDAFVSELLKKLNTQHDAKQAVAKVMVSESGASIYSASELATREYPDLDVTVRGAICIAHRLQDPLAELVKIDPKSIGVGQYQHDVNQTQLKHALEREVQSCVNLVGVDLNLASSSLLSHVAGIGPKLAERIIEHRDSQGRFESRQKLLKVPKLGRKVFEQAAGFLRIRDGKDPLDNSAVHPESYHIVEKMAKKLGVATSQLVGSSTLAASLNAEEFVDDNCGLPTVQDILEELAKPGRDPRSEFKMAKFAEGVNEIEDLKVGMILEAVVTNVTNFGAFVDLGVHQDGLIHISQLANEYIQSPGDVVSLGDVVRVKVLEVDLDRRRIAVSRKQA